MPLYDKLEICLVKAKPELSDLAPYESDLSISASDRMKLKKEFVATMTECVEVVLQRFLLFGRQPYSKNNELPEDCNFALITTEFDNTTYGDITWKIDDGGRLYDHFETGDKSWIHTNKIWGGLFTRLRCLMMQPLLTSPSVSVIEWRSSFLSLPNYLSSTL